MMTKKSLPILLLFILILICNASLFKGQTNQSFYIHTNFISQGHYWQLFTHPFAHLSLYHLVLNLFVLLILVAEIHAMKYTSLPKLLCMCFIFSSSFAFYHLPEYGLQTYAGISGINYGLCIYYCLQLILTNKNRIIKIISFSGFYYLLLEQVLEAYLGKSIYSSMHIGSIGTVITESHTGGILGALLFAFYQNIARKSIPPINNPAQFSY